MNDKERNLVVISFYDERPIEHLVALLDQLAGIDAGAPFDLLLVVNRTSDKPLDLPDRHRNIETLIRGNQGFNVGAWQAGWQSRPLYGFYLFLQDECIIEKPGWLAAFIETANKPRTGFVGESLFTYTSWPRYSVECPDTYQDCVRIAAEHVIDLGISPDCLQTLVIGASKSVLEQTGGFIVSDDKVAAMAGEVMTSVRARALGLINRQIAWRPFKYISHPQWASIREKSASPAWAISRAAHFWAPGPVRRLMELARK